MQTHAALARATSVDPAAVARAYEPQIDCMVRRNRRRSKHRCVSMSTYLQWRALKKGEWTGSLPRTQ